jgi:hypothetical protein
MANEISREAHAMYIAASHAISQAVDGGDTDDAGGAIFLLNLQNNYTRLLKGLPVKSKSAEPLSLTNPEGVSFRGDLEKMREQVASLTTEECEICDKAFAKKIEELRTLAAMVAKLQGRSGRGPDVKLASDSNTLLETMTPKGSA